MSKLSKKERKRIIDLLQKGDDIPLDYKHILFPPEKKEYELVYADKEREEDILANTMAVPLQPIKTFGKNGKGWTNKLIFGDNLQAMKSLLDNPEIKGKVKLIYIDPPFATKQDFKGSQDQKAYQDKIAGADFIEFLRKRLIYLKQLLAKDGVILVHLDYRKRHYIKIVMDEVFGESNFRNEIAIARIKKSMQEREYVKKLNEEFDGILFYASSDSAKINPPRKSSIKKERWHAFDAAELRKGMDYELFEYKPPSGRHWMYSNSKAKQMIKSGDLKPNSRTGKPQYRIPAGKQELCNNLWMDISGYSFFTKYPTEKSEQLLRRCISMLKIDSEDIVLDAFAGSGTTLAVAEKLGRRWIGIDCGKLAIYTIQKRMLNLKAEIGNKGNPFKPKPFTLYHAGLYDFSKLKRLDWGGWRFFALKLFNCRDNKHTLSGIELDGYRGRSDVLVFNYQQSGGVILDYGFIDDLHSMIGKKVGKQFFVIAPAASVVFLEDYIDKGSTRYYILRIPYSIINELHTRDFEAIKQPLDESQVNDTVDAVGFDFIRPPKVDCEYLLKKLGKENKKTAVIKIKTFKSEAMIKGASQLANRESLSMVMTDFNYKNDTFNLDKSFFAQEIENNGWEIHLPFDAIKENIMLVYLDIYGNEYREIKSIRNFKSSPKKKGGK